MVWEEAQSKSSKVFGSIAYARIPNKKRANINLKSKKLIVIGYNYSYKGYKLVDVNTN